MGHGGGHVYVNDCWVSSVRTLIDVSKAIKPGESNFVGIVCLNQNGPGGLMGRVKLLVRDRE